MLVNMLVLLLSRQAWVFLLCSLIPSSNAHTNHTIHISCHTNHTIHPTAHTNHTTHRRSHKIKLTTPACSLLPCSLTHARTHKHTHTPSTPSITSTSSTISTTNSTSDAATITSFSATNSCPTYTSTLEAKRCPPLSCGPQPMAQIGGGHLREARCAVESTTTMPCGCPTPMATTTVLGGCAESCPPKGCQIDWITAMPAPGSC